VTCLTWTTRWTSSSLCGFARFVRVVVIRAGSAADAAQIAAVQREGWFAAYEGIIPAEIIDRVTAPDNGARVRQTFRTRPWQRMLVAVAADQQDQGRAGDPAAPGIVGYASFGPETDVVSAPWPHPLTTDGEDGSIAELYALYVRPAWWSTGTGRALMERVLARTSAVGYLSITLWVLRDNRRARRFYERAGFAPDGATHVLHRLDDVTELRYRRELSPLALPVVITNDSGTDKNYLLDF
jgi:GNAT superfamily N-acetyltransferase